MVVILFSPLPYPFPKIEEVLFGAETYIRVTVTEGDNSHPKNNKKKQTKNILKHRILPLPLLLPPGPLFWLKNSLGCLTVTVN